MFLNLFKSLRNARVPVTIREYLTLIECLNKEIISYDIQEFYFLSRASLIKSEKYIDRFDQIFSEVFQGIERLTLSEIIERVELPADWLKKMAEKVMSEEEMNGLYTHPKIKALISLTHGEGFGLPLFEAAYSGLPVVAPEWSGHLDFLQEDKALLIGGELKQVPKSVVWDKIVLENSKWFYIDDNEIFYSDNYWNYER